MSVTPPKWNRTEWAAARKRALATLDPICAICHTPIDLEAPPFSPLSVEVDHIMPRARGGPLYELSNLQLTHSRCNRQKGIKMDEDYEEQKVVNQVPWSNQW